MTTNVFFFHLWRLPLELSTSKYYSTAWSLSISFIRGVSSLSWLRIRRLSRTLRVQELILFHICKSHLLWIQRYVVNSSKKFSTCFSCHIYRSCPVMSVSNTLILSVASYCNDYFKSFRTDVISSVPLWVELSSLLGFSSMDNIWQLFSDAMIICHSSGSSSDIHVSFWFNDWIYFFIYNYRWHVLLQEVVCILQLTHENRRTRCQSILMIWFITVSWIHENQFWSADIS